MATYDCGDFELTYIETEEFTVNKPKWDLNENDPVSLPLNKYGKVAVDFCSDQGAMKEQSPSSVTEEERRAG